MPLLIPPQRPQAVYEVLKPQIQLGNFLPLFVSEYDESETNFHCVNIIESLMEAAQPFSSIFLFINSASGGGVGNSILSQEVEKVEFDIALSKNSPSKLIYVYFFDLISKRSRAFGKLKQATIKGGRVIVIVCGGDGTIMWVVSEMHNYTIDPAKVAIAVLPLGTGNDFSQHLGWGKEKKATVVENKYRNLKKLIRRWLLAKEEDFDIWDVIAEVHQRGKFERVNKQSKSETVQGKVFRRSFCNYFSFGIDGKIGYSFDKHRTSSRVGNLMVYGAMGIIKSASKTKSIKELVEVMEVRHDLGEEKIEHEQPLDPPKEHLKSKQISLENSRINKLNNAEQSVIFSESKDHTLQLESDYYNLLVLNIDSYMGGVKDIWKKADSKEMEKRKEIFHEQQSDDGEIEILSFSSSVGMALERVFGGFSSKIAQGGGPYCITFKQCEDQKHRTYMQIDGEYIRINHPSTIVIRKSFLSPNGKIRVLRRNLAADQQE